MILNVASPDKINYILKNYADTGLRSQTLNLLVRGGIYKLRPGEDFNVVNAYLVNEFEDMYACSDEFLTRGLEHCRVLLANTSTRDFLAVLES